MLFSHVHLVVQLDTLRQVSLALKSLQYNSLLLLLESRECFSSAYGIFAKVGEELKHSWYTLL